MLDLFNGNITNQWVGLSKFLDAPTASHHHLGMAYRYYCDQLNRLVVR